MKAKSFKKLLFQGAFGDKKYIFKHIKMTATLCTHHQRTFACIKILKIVQFTLKIVLTLNENKVIQKVVISRCI